MQLNRVRRLVAVLLITFGLYSLIIHLFMAPDEPAKQPRDILSLNEEEQSAKDYDPGEMRHKIPHLNKLEVINLRLPLPARTANLMDQNLEEAELDGSILSDQVLSLNNSELLLEEFLNIRPNAVETSNKDLPICPDVPDIKGLQGQIQQATLLIQNLKEAEIIKRHPLLRSGGSWKPTECRARYKVAIIVPFRDRQTHLSRLLDYLVPILIRQLLDFRFIVTEQYGSELFNKGRIMNAAFNVADRLGVDCVLFHDVDMFPQDDRNSYSCPQNPRHIGAFVSNLGYQLWYDYIVGGVLSIRMEHYRTVNGYSNKYWAWGGEDDDMGKRIQALNFTIERPDPIYGRFTMLKHVKRKRTAPNLIYKLIASAGTRMPTDGLNEKGKWNVIKITRRPLYYHLYVDVGTAPSQWRQGQ